MTGIGYSAHHGNCGDACLSAYIETHGERATIGLERLINIAFGIASSPGCLAGAPGEPVTAERLSAIVYDLVGDDLDGNVFSVPVEALRFEGK